MTRLETRLVYFEVVFIFRSSSFWGCPYLEIILIKRSSSLQGGFCFEVRLNLRSVVFRGPPHFEVVFMLRLFSFWGHLHFEDVFIWRLSSFWGHLHLRSYSFFSGTYSFHAKYHLPAWSRSCLMWTNCYYFNTVIKELESNWPFGILTIYIFSRWIWSLRLFDFS